MDILTASLCLMCIGGLCVTSQAFENNKTVKERGRRSVGFKTVCYQGHGCFYTGPPFKSIPFRIISLPPLPPGVIRTTYLLFTRRNRNNPLSFSPFNLESLVQSEFNPFSWTRIVVHGYFDGTYLSSWMLNMKDDFLRLEDDNVILVDHSTTAQLPRILYEQSVADTRLIGVQLSNLITFLIEKCGGDLKKIHIIGHSLGAEIAGYAGERLRNLGRITALDPAGPYFRNVPRNVGLDDTDANLVDVIHSNPAPYILLGFGNPKDIGHVNFWPNGGKQRGCPLTVFREVFNGVFPIESVQSSIACRHRRSYEYFTFSFNQNDCLFVGTECSSWADFLQGKCDCGQQGEKCSVMGVFTAPKPLPKHRYYLKVGNDRPYCLHQYQVAVYLHTAGGISKSLRVNVELSIYGKQMIQEKLKLNIDLGIQKQVNTFLITAPQRIGSINSAEVSSNGDIFNATNVIVEAVKINYLYPAPRKQTEFKLCRPSEEPKKNVAFSSNHCKWD